jgi:hypothetical protein
MEDLADIDAVSDELGRCHVHRPPVLAVREIAVKLAES